MTSSTPNGHVLVVAPVLIVREHAGRLKAALARSPLRGLDPPGVLPAIGNYRSDAVMRTSGSITSRRLTPSGTPSGIDRFAGEA